MSRALHLCLLMLALVLPVQAQDSTSTPIASHELRDVQAMAVAENGEVLFVTDARSRSLFVFDLDLNLISEVGLDGQPLALAAAQDFALVAVEIEGRGDLLVVIGADPFAEGGYGLVSFSDIPDETTQISVSPDQRWAAMTGSTWSRVFQIIAQDDMIGYVTEGDSSPTGVTLGSGMVFFAQESPSQIVQYLLRANQPPRSARTLALDGVPSALSLNARMSLGAALVDGQQIVLFDTAALQMIAQLDVEDSRLLSAQFVTREDGEWLAVLPAEGEVVRLYDVTVPSELAEIGSVPVGLQAEQMLVYEDLLLVSDGNIIRVYRLV